MTTPPLWKHACKDCDAWWRGKCHPANTPSMAAEKRCKRTKGENHA